jgi:PIN domain nuclease of toxin-antitoxin system
MTGSPFLFDSYALLLLLQKEKGFEKVANLLGEIQQSGIPKYLNAINLGEIIYITNLMPTVLPCRRPLSRRPFW